MMENTFIFSSQRSKAPLCEQGRKRPLQSSKVMLHSKLALVVGSDETVEVKKWWR